MTQPRVGDRRCLPRFALALRRHVKTVGRAQTTGSRRRRILAESEGGESFPDQTDVCASKIVRGRLDDAVTYIEKRGRARAVLKTFVDVEQGAMVGFPSYGIEEVRRWLEAVGEAVRVK
jgi:hypothetical protein